METEFRNKEEEVVRLLEEFSELKRMLKTISSQLTRLETRIKVNFPAATKQVENRRAAFSKQTTSTLTSERAQQEFESIVQIARSGTAAEAENYLERHAGPDLLVIAKEVGVSFKTSKPSIKAMREAILGKVRESILLSHHNRRP